MTKNFRVPDATCGHCKSTIEQKVSGLAGVRAAEFDLASKQLAVDLDEGASPEAIVAAVSAAGYTPEVMS